MYGETGQVCKIGSVYKCFGHPEFSINMKEDEIFPKCCMDKPHDALWIKVAVAVPEKESRQTDGDLELTS